MDNEGMQWRMFTPECYKKVAHMTPEEIYNKYPVAPWVEEER